MSGQQSVMKSGRVSSAGDFRESNVAYTTSTGQTGTSDDCVSQGQTSLSLASTRHMSKQVTRGPRKMFEPGMTRKMAECELAADKARPASQLRRPATRVPKSADIGVNNCNSTAPVAIRKIPRGTSQFKSFAGVAKT